MRRRRACRLVLLARLAAAEPVRYCETNPRTANITDIKASLWPHGDDNLQRGGRRNARHWEPTASDLLEHADYNASRRAFEVIVGELMAGTSFHSHLHLLRPLLSLTCRHGRKCVYLEIGSFCGASMALALSYPGLTRAIAVSPRMKVIGIQADKFYWRNSACLNLNNVDHAYFPATSERALADVKRALGGDLVDVLFVDGDHNHSAVRFDFENYAPLVRPGGAILMDDYGDSWGSPGVQTAMDELTRPASFCAEQYHCLGALPNAAGATSTCAYQPGFWARLLKPKPCNPRHADCSRPNYFCPGRPPERNLEYVLFKRASTAVAKE